MKAIIFDVDGVIVDVRESYHHAIKRTAEFFLGREVPLEEVKRIKFSNAIKNDWDATYAVIKEFGGDVDYDTLVDKFTEFYEVLKHKEKQLLSSDFFRALKGTGAPMGIVTGRPKVDLDFVLDRFSLREFFDVTIDEDYVEDKSKRKPHPYPLHLCMEKLGAKEGIYIGDNEADRKMVSAYKNTYKKPMKFVHFKKVVNMDLPADFSTDREEDLKSYLLEEVSRRQEAV